MRSDLTELESCVLGVIWRRGPCSAYLVRREFDVSASAHWSSSAGSIYPVVRRLQAAGLVDAETRPWGRSGAKEFFVTAQGIETLKAWVTNFDATLAGPSLDHIRTRANFLGVLASERDRLAFLDKAEADTLAQLPRVKDAIEVSRNRPSAIEYWAALGGLYELKARLSWLRAVRKGLSVPEGSEPSDA